MRLTSGALFPDLAIIDLVVDCCNQDGDIAQLVERTDRTREARGSNPLISKFFESYGLRIARNNYLLLQTIDRSY